ncbi:hypothetical protein ACVIGA_005122 [Bradyrhizobium sp. USDA 3240]
MPSKRVTFDPEGPLWDILNGERYPTWSCPFCNVEFDEQSSGGVAWVSKHGMLCCSEICAGFTYLVSS